MSKLRISDAPLLPDVSGLEKIPTGGRGDLAISMDQVKTFAQGGLPQQIENHINDTENPHQVSKSQVGLGNVDNTSDLDKPVSTAQQEALNLKSDKVTTYTKIEVDSRLGLKADKTYVDTNLNLKADKTAVHSKSATLPTYYIKEDGVNSVIGVTNSAYFNVRSTDEDTVLVEYQNVGGSAVATGKSSPSSYYVETIAEYTALPFKQGKSYALYERVQLANGDIVKSILDGNTVDPNVDMTGWVYDNYIYKNYHLVSKWGAKGDGVTQDRTAIQAAIDDLHAIYMSTGIVQTLIYEDNRKYVCHNVVIKEGVNHVAIGQSTLLKTPATPDETETNLYWRRIFYPSVDANSLFKDRILIENLIFDGNYNNMNWTWGTYSQQQGGNLYIQSTSIPPGKRFKCELRNVVLKDTVGDGLLVARNNDVIIRGLKAENCFRGGVTIVGGNSIIDIDGMIGESANLHIELDGGGNDADTPYKIIGSFKNITIDKDHGLDAPWGGFAYTNSAGSAVTFENVNVYSRGFSLEGTSIGDDLTRDLPSSADFHNCHFVVSRTSRVFFPRGMNFHTCTFKYKMLEDATADNNGMAWYWRTISGSAPVGQISNFYDCKFIGDTANGFKFRSAFAVDATTNDRYGFLNTYRCTFSGFRYGFYAPNGYRGEQCDCIYDSETGILVGSSALVGGGSLKFKLKNPTFTENCPRALRINESLNDGTTELEFVDVSIDRSKLNQADLATINGTLKGFLEVTSDVAPDPLSTSVDTLWGGTRWKVLANTAIPVYEYVNTAANGVKNKGTWLASVFVTKTGDTATRPTLTKFDVGVTYFNTETSKVEFWNGSAWV